MLSRCDSRPATADKPAPQEAANIALPSWAPYPEESCQSFQDPTDTTLVPRSHDRTVHQRRNAAARRNARCGSHGHE